MNQVKAQDFPSFESREKIIQELDKCMIKYGHLGTNQSSVEIESQIHQKARNKEEYMNLVARFLIHLKDVTGAPNNVGNVGPSQKGIVPHVVAQTVMGAHDEDDKTKLGQQIQMSGQQRVQMMQVSNSTQIPGQQLLQQAAPQIAALSQGPQLSGMPNLINSAHLGNLQQATNVSMFQGSHTIQSGQGLSAQISGNINVSQASSLSLQEQLKQLQQARKGQPLQQAKQQQTQPKTQHLGRTMPNKSPILNQSSTGTPQQTYGMSTPKGHPSPSPSQGTQVYTARPDPSPASSTGPVAQSPLAAQPSPSPAAATPGNPASWGGPAPSPLDASEESAYAEKLKELAKYIEPLRSLINQMPKDGEHATKIRKLQQIEEIFVNKKRVNLTVLCRCEKVVHTLLSSDTSSVNPKPNMLQTVTDHLAPLAANPSLVAAAHQCIYPVQRTLRTPTIKQPKPPRKRRRPSSDDEDCGSNLPDALQMEIAHLWNRFTFNVDSGSNVDKSFFTISCKTKKSGLPSLPPLVIRVPASYPKKMPEYNTINTDSGANLLIEQVKRNFGGRLLESQKEQFHSVTYILEAWEKSVQETLEK